MASAALTAQGMSLSLTAKDLARSRHFYIDGLGFEVEEEYEMDGVVRGAMLKAGTVRVGLSQDDFSKGRDRVKGIGMRMYFETDQDLGALAQRLKDAGISLDGEPAPLSWGPMGFSLTDPDGFGITIANAS